MAGDDVIMGVAAIVGSHTSKQLSAILKPKVDGGRMTIDMPLGFGGDATPIITLMGVAAAVAVPALQKYMRRAKTAEAEVQLFKIYDAVASEFKAEHAVRRADSTVEFAHQCPNNGQLSGEAGITPPLSVNCNEGPGGRCVPSKDGGGPGYYDLTMWTENPVWKAMGYMQEQSHYFHYNFIWTNDPEGYGSCQFTVQAFADLDDDGVYSTFERSGAGDMMGINAAIGLYIDNEVE